MVRRYSTKSISRKTKIRAKLKRFCHRPRLSAFRSNKYVFAQIIDDSLGKTLVSSSEKDLKSVGAALRGRPLKSAGVQRTAPAGSPRLTSAFRVGEILAKKALKKKITKVYFDRGCYKYHGRVKALAEGARKGGLDF